MSILLAFIVLGIFSLLALAFVVVLIAAFVNRGAPKK